jgi:hypothetical protein
MFKPPLKWMPLGLRVHPVGLFVFSAFMVHDIYGRDVPTFSVATPRFIRYVGITLWKDTSDITESCVRSGGVKGCVCWGRVWGDGENFGGSCTWGRAKKPPWRPCPPVCWCIWAPWAARYRHGINSVTLFVLGVGLLEPMGRSEGREGAVRVFTRH